MGLQVACCFTARSTSIIPALPLQIQTSAMHAPHHMSRYVGVFEVIKLVVLPQPMLTFGMVLLRILHQFTILRAIRIHAPCLQIAFARALTFVPGRSGLLILAVNVLCDRVQGTRLPALTLSGPRHDLRSCVRMANISDQTSICNLKNNKLHTANNKAIKLAVKLYTLTHLANTKTVLLAVEYFKSVITNKLTASHNSAPYS